MLPFVHCCAFGLECAARKNMQCLFLSCLRYLHLTEEGARSNAAGEVAKFQAKLEADVRQLEEEQAEAAKTRAREADSAAIAASAAAAAAAAAAKATGPVGGAVTAGDAGGGGIRGHGDRLGLRRGAQQRALSSESIGLSLAQVPVEAASSSNSSSNNNNHSSSSSSSSSSCRKVVSTVLAAGPPPPARPQLPPLQPPKGRRQRHQSRDGSDDDDDDASIDSRNSIGFGRSLCPASGCCSTPCRVLSYHYPFSPGLSPGLAFSRARSLSISFALCLVALDLALCSVCYVLGRWAPPRRRASTTGTARSARASSGSPSPATSTASWTTPSTS